MELSSRNLKKLLIFQEGTYRTWKSNKKPAPKKFLVSWDNFVVFPEVKYRETPRDYFNAM